MSDEEMSTEECKKELNKAVKGLIKSILENNILTFMFGVCVGAVIICLI